MTRISAFIHGVYPRSEALAKITRDLDRGRAKEKDYRRKLDLDFNNLLRAQKLSRLDYFEDGKLSWQDIFRPFIEATSGMEAGSLCRWFDNNTFYRQPVIKKKLKLNEVKLVEFFPQISKNWKVTLPSPFTFARLTLDETNSNFEKTLAEITELFISVQDFLKKEGVSYIQFNEPYLVYHKAAESDIKLFNKSIKKLQKGRNGIKLGIQFYFGDASKIINKLDSADFDSVGIDFYKTSLAKLPKKVSMNIACGVIDGRNSLIEDPKVLIKFIEAASSHLAPETLYITNNSDLELLPQIVAEKKLKVLGKVRKHFRK